MKPPIPRSPTLRFYPALIVGIFIFAIIFLSAAYFTIDEGERGVKLRLGKVVSVAEPGLTFKIPLIESVVKISVQHHTVRYDQIRAYSSDQQPAELKISVTYHVPPAEVVKIYSLFGGLKPFTDRIISRQTPSQVENVFGKYTAISVVQDRAKFVQDINVAVRESVRDMPIIIDSVQIENIDFSDSYERSVEDRMKAEVAIATRKQNLETERINAEIAVTQAKARAESQLTEAQAAAEAIRLTGEAEAAAIRARGEALQQNIMLVQLIAAEKWDGQLPKQMIPNSAVPFIELVQPTPQE